ncbi:MAG TPA: glutamine synthetase III [Paludibacteraceae bacterium]|nr:glutamine synthetase III [Paludibacteraceae bacterium]HPL93506.1 glutamine synthetase III [Paludibacteraceae bacterium]
MNTLRFKVLDEAFRRKAVQLPESKERLTDYYAKYVFDRNKMQRYLSKNTYGILTNSIDKGEPLNRSIADGVATGMKQWAMEMGATHYTHWFQPLTGGTAEKHDSFLDFNNIGGVIEDFSGKLLAQQEPDASSFPSGGIRNTFEARGYTAWDPSSPAFVVGDTLCIPTIFISYTGEALDYKTPLLKSIGVLNKAAVDVCKYFDENVSKVTSFLGWEQEYFLVDEALWAARPDLMLTGRTLMGHSSAKNQQLEDHYFGAIPSRVLAFMKDLEIESLKLGIPAKTRHNEVAPNQFELAPIYEESNLANDHNLLLMSVMKKIARRHNFRILFHEKPFKGINGSGKHNNWSIGTDTGVNLLSPGKTGIENLQFITFMVNVLMAVYKNNALLKASISSATNAHRLGANEAPPAVVSVFLGKQITNFLDKMEVASTDEAIIFDDKVGIRLGVAHIPEILLDNTDRNRTSPFAFTGNRFEFRAVGSSANCGGAMMALNTAVAGQLKQFKTEVDALIASGMLKEKAIVTVLKKYITISKPIRFDGNGYSDEWKIEAAKRGLDCETSVPKIFDAYLSKQSIELFKKTNILSEVELHSRCEVKWETYTKKIQIEARVLGDLAMNHILPLASRYQSLLLDNVSKISTIFSADEAKSMTEQDRTIIKTIANHISEIAKQTTELISARKVANKIESEREKAIAYHDTVIPVMDELRSHIDDLEMIVDDEMWTLPKYRELLFIR